MLRIFKVKTIKKSNFLILLLGVSLVFLLAFYTITGLFSSEQNITRLKTKYEIRHLGGDDPHKWPAWKLTAAQPLSVEIVNPGIVSKDKISIIKEAIFSEESKQADSSFMQSTTDGSLNQLYKGWKGALVQAAKHKTTYQIPLGFEITDSDNQESKITITLTKMKSAEGYAGYTSLMSANNHILKSEITIYNIDGLTNEQLATVVRHELGHALGLSHADEPDDLMHDTVRTPSFISGCDINAVVAVYNAEKNIGFECGTPSEHKLA